jgi:CrcB-like protein involved in camphor resistance
MKTSAARQMPQAPRRLLRAYATAADLGPCTMVRRARRGPFAWYGFTTFSAFSLDVALFYERGQPWLAAIYVLASVILSIAGLFVGMWIMRTLT